MSNIPSMSEHGEFVPDRQIQVHREPHMQRMTIYCKMGTFADGWRMYATRPIGKPPFWMVVAPMQEPPLYLVIGDQEAEAIAEAIMKRPEATERHLNDAMNVRDRLLQMLERQNESATVRP